MSNIRIPENLVFERECMDNDFKIYEYITKQISLYQKCPGYTVHLVGSALVRILQIPEYQIKISCNWLINKEYLNDKDFCIIWE